MHKIYSLNYEKKAVKELAAIPSEDRVKLVRKIESILTDPYRSSGVKKLKGRDAYRVRYGSYRAIYIVIDNLVKVKVIKIGNRDKVYK